MYAYDATGNLDSADSGISRWWVSHRNKLGQITGEVSWLSGQNAWGIGYSYDGYGHLSQIHYPGADEYVDYAPDALGRPTRVGHYVTGIGYFPDGDPQRYAFDNGTLFMTQKNARQLPSNLSYGRGGTLPLSEDLRYDANGNLNAIDDLADGIRGKSFGYDGLQRLNNARANGLWRAEHYTFDALNNLRSREIDGQVYAYQYDAANRLRTITHAGTTVNTFGYDTRGNINDKNGASLLFDQKNQLIRIIADRRYDYDYDAAGRRVRKTIDGGAATYYFYTQGGQLLYQYEAATTKQTNYIYLGSKPIARDEHFGSQVIGDIDNVTFDGSGLAHVNGWACSTGIAQLLDVHLYVDGPVGSGTFIEHVLRLVEN